MAVKKFKPVTPGQRNKVISSFDDITCKNAKCRSWCSCCAIKLIQLDLKWFPSKSSTWKKWH